MFKLILSSILYNKLFFIKKLFLLYLFARTSTVVVYCDRAATYLEMH